MTERHEEERPIAMRCPACGAESRVRKSQPRWHDLIYRRRECTNPECGVRFSTNEKIVPSKPVIA